MLKFLSTCTAALMLSTATLCADEITDTLESAIQAYQDGDIQYALDEIELAKQQLIGLKTDALGAYLPPAKDGWTREVNKEASKGLAMMGGGVAAEATYSNVETSYTINLMADNAMVASVAGIINNAAIMGLEIKRVKRQKFAVQNNELMGLVANRVLVRVSGADTDTMVAALEDMDFRAMSNFGQ